MLISLQPGQLLLFALAGWVNRQQQAAIDYLREENRILREQLGARRLRFTDDQRRRLAAKAKALGRTALDALATLVAPETLRAWHRAPIARKWDFSSRRRKPGRPPLLQEIARRVVRLTLASGRVTVRWPVANASAARSAPTIAAQSSALTTVDTTSSFLGDVYFTAVRPAESFIPEITERSLRA